MFIYIHGNGNLDIIIIGLKKLSNYVIVHIYIYENDNLDTSIGYFSLWTF